MTGPLPLEIARGVMDRGGMPVPIPHGKKCPVFDDWTNFRTTREELPNHFNGRPGNVGILNGGPSNNRCDVDLDCPEAVLLAPDFLPQTGSIHGRASNPRSHRGYIATVDTTRFTAPKGGARLLEILSTGSQTVWPGSTHPSGELYEWDEDGAPSVVEGQELLKAARRLAAACLLARHWPAQGSRQDASLALAGALLRAEWPEEEIEHFIAAIAYATGDEEIRMRVKTVCATVRALERDADRKTTGWPTLAGIVGDDVVSRVREWLQVNDRATQAKSATWNDPEPLPDDLLAVPEFDARILPDALAAWTTDISERLQCPPEFPAVTALVAAASLVGNALRIRPKREDDWSVVPNLWGATVGKPGVLKTPATEEALKPLRAREALAREEHNAAQSEYKFEKDYAEAQLAEIRGRMKKAKGVDDKEALRLEYDRTNIVAPVERRYLTNDPTTEKLGELLNQNSRGILLFRDELTGWFRSLDREGREQDRSFFLETWTGSGSYTYDRIGRGTLRIDNLTLSIFGTIQPGPLSQYLRGAVGGGYGDDGLMQRFQLLVYPDTSKAWRNVDRQPHAEAARMAHECFARLDQLQPTDVDASIVVSESSAPLAYLRFGGEAQEFFNGWREDLETSLRSGAFEHPALEAHMAKYRSLMPSLALLFHLTDRVSGVTDSAGVTLDAAQRSAVWCSFLEAHARRIYGLALNSEVRTAKLILEHIRKGDLPPEFTARDVYRKNWAGLSSAKDAADPLAILEDYNWIRSFTVGSNDAGGRPTTRYLAHPALTEGRQ